MGCGVSKIHLKEAGQGFQIKSLRRRSQVYKDNVIRGDEADSVTSMTGESGFLKMVIGSNEKDNGVDANSDETTEKDSTKEKTKDQHEDNNNDHHPEYVGASNAEKRAASILCSPGSPSFRVYCVNDLPAASDKDSDDGEREESKSDKGSSKGSEGGQAKRGRKGRGFRSAMQMAGGSTRGLRGVLQRATSSGNYKKNIVTANTCRSQTSSTSRDTIIKFTAKAV